MLYLKNHHVICYFISFVLFINILLRLREKIFVYLYVYIYVLHIYTGMYMYICVVWKWNLIWEISKRNIKKNGKNYKDKKVC